MMIAVSIMIVIITMVTINLIVCHCDYHQHCCLCYLQDVRGVSRNPRPDEGRMPWC